MIVDEDEYDLYHYGTKHHSGRYPWGSGKDGDHATLLGTVDELSKQGMNEKQIATALNMTQNDLRKAKALAKQAKKQYDIEFAQKLKDKGYSNIAIGERMGINESSVRDLLKPGQLEKAKVTSSTADMLKNEIAKKQFIDVGKGVEQHINVPRVKLDQAIKALKDEGYKMYYVPIEQLGTGHQTNTKVLAGPDTTFKQVMDNKDKISQPFHVSDNGGKSFSRIQPPLSISSKRVAVRYAEQGGKDADGVIFVRPGVKDVSLGGIGYGQVRIAVDGTHYLKGMAMYKDDLPPGIDLMFNTNKSNTGNKLDAMKPMKDDPDMPFGSMINRQITEKDAFGQDKVTSVMNIVNGEGSWEKWSNNLSSQVLSKQPTALAKTQLDKAAQRYEQEFAEIMRTSNPVVRQRLLQSFSDGVDTAAVNLKAAALPNQGTHVILPIASMKPTEIYAPNYENGTRVALIRFPHGGKFEIPELTVNNRQPEAKKLLGRARDAVGIHSSVAERLSGADFDGDTVLVIPNNHGKIKTEPALEGLKGFDPQKYKVPLGPNDEGKTMTPKQKGVQMGEVTNLIADMSLRGASQEEKARAIRHSMVVIDAEKHNLDWKRSAKDNGIAALKTKYQGGATKGASTLITRAASDVRVPERKARSADQGGFIDKATGEKVWVYTGATYVKRTESPKTGKVTEKVVVKNDPQKSTKLAETKDAHTLSSGTPIEAVYADHSNRLKALANAARKEMVNTKAPSYSPSANKVYKEQVASLDAALRLALRNSPLERQALVIANAAVQKKTQANPDMEKGDIKKLRARELQIARLRTGAKKEQISISDKEWEAIQAGAISPSKLRQILNHADLDRVKELATPKQHLVMDSAQTSRAKAMENSGHTAAEIASALGVSVSTVKKALGGGSNG